MSSISGGYLEDAGLREMHFTHPYEPPHGSSSAPLLVLPMWFPVEIPPLETLSLDQVLYRSLASVREPFRRSRLLLADRDRVRPLYTQLLDWSVSWAESNLGATLIPVPLSLSRLAASGPELERLTQRLAGSGSTAGLGCLEILESGMSVPADSVEELVAALVMGNAWLLIEDDCDGNADLEPVKKAFDAVFGAPALSHVAIVLVTARKDCSVLSGIQTFSAQATQEVAERPGRASALLRPTAGLCRILSRCGSLPLLPSLIVLAILALGFLAFLFLNYGAIGDMAPALGAQQGAAQKLRVPSVLLLLLLPFLGMITANVWGLSYGSEEVRAQSVGLVLSSMFMFGAFLLVPLPSSMDPGWLKNACILLAGLPAAALFAVVSLTTFAVVADILWLILSLRICRRLGASGLAAVAQSYRVVLHMAVYGAEVRVPHGPHARAKLPLLLCSKNAAVLPGLLSRYPALAPQIRKMIFTGIRKDPRPYSMSVASLALDAVARGERGATRACLEPLGMECLDLWLNRDDFESGSGMNGLEYVARRLCYLTNLEELIVIR